MLYSTYAKNFAYTLCQKLKLTNNSKAFFIASHDASSGSRRNRIESRLTLDNNQFKVSYINLFNSNKFYLKYLDRMIKPNADNPRWPANRS